MTSGKLEKMLILAFDSSAAANSGSQDMALQRFEALINPEGYTLEYKVRTAEGQGQGTSSVQSVYSFSPPEELSFEFLFDNTGIIDGKPSKDGVFDEVNRFRDLLIKYQEASMGPYHLQLIWGNLLFRGRAVELSIAYKLFNPNGQPIRALAKAKFKGSIEEKRRAAQEGKLGQDVFKAVQAKAGDSLPLLCQRIYGATGRHADVARANGLNSLRSLKPGTQLVFPPRPKMPRAL